MNQEELNKKILLHGKWLRREEGGERLHLRNMNLRYADLRGAYLVSADLRGATLIGADLRGADLTDAICLHTNLSYTDLRGADLRGAYLKGACLYYADLKRANLSRAILRWTNLIEADLYGTDLSYVDLCFARGNGKEIVSIKMPEWPTVMTKDVIAIGCKQYSVTEWRSFSDEEIDEMEPYALEWWKENKELIFSEHRKHFGKGE